MLRIRDSAARLGWCVPDEQLLQGKLYQAILGQAHLTLRLRLTVDRSGKVEIGVIETTVQKNLLGPFSNQAGLQSRGPVVTPRYHSEEWTLLLDTKSTPVEQLRPLIENKTTSRAHYVDPMSRTGASLSSHQEVLLYNGQDEVTEGTITNVIFKRDGNWVTPKLTCGLLGGVMRSHLLTQGKITEAVIKKQDLVDGEEVLLCNAVRGVLRATMRFTNS